MKTRPRDANGPTPDPRPADPPPDGGPDLLSEAEELKAALAVASQRAGRLVAALRQTRRQERALTSVWSRLKSLHLGR